MDPKLFRAAFDVAPEGVMICDARAEDYPVLYVNRAMEQLSGYAAEQLLGRNPRLLQGEHREQESVAALRAALREGIGCRVVVRNARPDGALYFNDVTLAPLKDEQGAITHFVSFHHEGAGSPKPGTAGPEKDAMLSTQTMLAYVRDDKLTGLLRRSYFEDLLLRDWGLAQRESKRLALAAFDMDFSSQYREVFGNHGVDQCFRRIARVISGCYRRTTDLCARFDEDQVVAMTFASEHVNAVKFVETILGRVHGLAIHHPRSSVSRYVTVSAGVAMVTPKTGVRPEQLVNAALSALQRAKELGRNRVVSAGEIK